VTHGFLADVDPAFMEQVLNIAKRAWKPDLHHHCELDDLRRCVEI